MTEQNHAIQMQGLWRRLEEWAAIHAPCMLGGLDGPASETEIRALERELDISLPLAFRTSLQLHNGEDDGDNSILAHYGHLLSSDIILRHWQWGIRYGSEQGTLGLEDPYAWTASILDGHYTVHGPVKPLSHSRRWIPIASFDGKVNLYLDFDPPEGGTPGQVIRTVIEFGQWQVLASSFLAFFHQYVHDLEEGQYRVDADGWIEPYTDDFPQPSRQLPAYLQGVVFEQPALSPSVVPDIESLTPGQTVTLEGTMAHLQGNGSEILFTLKIPGGRAYSIFASAKRTAGFLQIRVRQHARVVVARPDGAIESQLRPSACFIPIELIAVQYTMLRG